MGGKINEVDNYPQTYEDFIEWFKTEEDCINYLTKIRWQDGFKCPKCFSIKACTTRRGLLHCYNCGHQTSVIAGTLFQGTRKPLR